MYPLVDEGCWATVTGPRPKIFVIPTGSAGKAVVAPWVREWPGIAIQLGNQSNPFELFLYFFPRTSGGGPGIDSGDSLHNLFLPGTLDFLDHLRFDALEEAACHR